jgi:nitrate reductase gamma subunit
MAETNVSSDVDLGVSLLFGFVVALATIVMAWAAYASEAQESETLQIVSGIALTVALLAGGIAIAAVHIFE